MLEIVALIAVLSQQQQTQLVEAQPSLKIEVIKPSRQGGPCGCEACPWFVEYPPATVTSETKE